jgi:hypothetical protein
MDSEDDCIEMIATIYASCIDGCVTIAHERGVHDHKAIQLHL